MKASVATDDLRLVAWSLSGGLLVAAAVLNIASARLRSRVHATARRLLRKAPEIVAPAADAKGFWERYERVKRISQGPAWTVYEARDRALGCRLAVKKLSGEVAGDASERHRYVLAARAAAALRHPRVVQVHAVEEEGADVYIVFEHVDGESARQTLRKGPFPLERAVAVLRDVCQAVDFAWRHGLVHGDLDSSSVMLDDEGRAKVMNFGMGPNGFRPRRENDVLALGVLLCEMLSGERPVPGHMVRRLPARLEPALAKALASDPRARYGSPLEFLSAVEAASGLGRS